MDEHLGNGKCKRKQMEILEHKSVLYKFNNSLYTFVSAHKEIMGMRHVISP